MKSKHLHIHISGLLADHLFLLVCLLNCKSQYISYFTNLRKQRLHEIISKTSRLSVSHYNLCYLDLYSSTSCLCVVSFGWSVTFCVAICNLAVYRQKYRAIINKLVNCDLLLLSEKSH